MIKELLTKTAAKMTEIKQDGFQEKCPIGIKRILMEGLNSHDDR